MAESSPTGRRPSSPSARTTTMPFALASPAARTRMSGPSWQRCGEWRQSSRPAVRQATGSSSFRAADTRLSAKSPTSPAAAAGRSPVCRSSGGGSTTSSARSPPRRPNQPPWPPRRNPMRNVLTIFRRELAAYFSTPLAYVFIVIFLVMAGILTFFVGNFFERGQADLQPFFTFHPWLYVVLIPALSMRLWAEERRSGTIELFLTLPIRMTEAVAGKFLAAWCFAGSAVILTFPLWLTVNFLGHPDNGVILASYIASWLMAGAFLAGRACISAGGQKPGLALLV